MAKKRKFVDASEERQALLWDHAKRNGVELTPNRVIVTGVVFQKSDQGLQILSGQTNFYDPLPDEDVKVFVENGLEAGVKNFLVKKYTGLIERVSRLIQMELSSQRNQKRIESLKRQRNEFTEKIASL